jgi:ADP-ribose pyrophosphatase YjhB (NUDIX family)
MAVLRDDRILLAQRVDPPYAGRFTLPGGLVEPGETLAAAAVRELKEEVGIEARILGFNRHVEIIAEDSDGTVRQHYVIASFVGLWQAGEGSVGPEAKAIRWVSRDEVASLPVTDHLGPVLDGAWALGSQNSRSC